MQTNLTLEYWKDDGWYVGRLKEVPVVFSQGETLEELEGRICETYRLMLAEARLSAPQIVGTRKLPFEM